MASSRGKAIPLNAFRLDHEQLRSAGEPVGALLQLSSGRASTHRSTQLHENAECTLSSCRGSVGSPLELMFASMQHQPPKRGPGRPLHPCTMGGANAWRGRADEPSPLPSDTVFNGQSSKQTHKTRPSAAADLPEYEY